MKLIVRTRQLAKKPKAHCKTKVNLETDGSTVNNYNVQLGDDICHEFDGTQLRVSINRSIGLKIKLINTEHLTEESSLNQAKNYNY